MAWHPRSTDQIVWTGENVNNPAFLAERVGVIVESIEGLLDNPPMRVTNRNRTGRHGARRGKRRMSPRAFAMNGIVFGSSYDDVEARKVALESLFVPDSRDEDGGLFEFVHPVFGALRVTARVEQEFVYGDPFERGATWPEVGIAWSVGMVAHDPLLYSSTLTTVQTSDIATGGGMSFPAAFPLSFAAGSTGGAVTVPAGGNFDRAAVLTIHGPVTNPVIEDVSGDSGLEVTFEALAISAGDYVEIDTDAHTARLYYGSIAGSLNVYSYLDPNQTTITSLPKDAVTLRLRGSTITDPAYLEVETRDAYV